MKNNNKIELPPLKQLYKLSDENQCIVDRFVDELKHRLKTDVTVDIYKENFLGYPVKALDRITVEVVTGNWRRVGTIIEHELQIGQGEVFYYFFRKMIDDIMADLLVRGARGW